MSRPPTRGDAQRTIRGGLASLRGAAEDKPRSRGHPLPDCTCTTTHYRCTCTRRTAPCIAQVPHCPPLGSPPQPLGIAAARPRSTTIDRKARTPTPGWGMDARLPDRGAHRQHTILCPRRNPVKHGCDRRKSRPRHILLSENGKPPRSHPPHPHNTDLPPPPIFPPWPSPHGSSPPPHGVPPTKRTRRHPKVTARPSTPPRPTPPHTPTGPSL